jgi:hypothetical protein
VGKSLNVGNPVTGNELSAGRSLAIPNLPATDEFNIFYGHSLYDGPSGLSTVHFAEFGGTNSFCFSIFAAALKSPVHWAQGVTFDATVSAASKFHFAKSTDVGMMYSSGLIDRDGSITGTANTVITPKIIPHPSYPSRIYENTYNRRPAAVEQVAWGAYVNTGAAFRLHRTDDYTHNGTSYTTYPQYAIRSDGSAMFDGATDFAAVVPSWHQNPVIPNDTNYRYFWQRHKIPNRTQTTLHFANDNDYIISVFPNMPSGTYVYGTVTTAGTTNTTSPLTKAVSYDALKSSAAQGYFIANNSLYLKQVASTADEPYATTPFGHGRKSAPINICMLPNCAYATQTGERTEMTLADLELGPDSRFSVSKTGVLGLPVLSYDATAASDPNDGTNNKVSWTINKVADAADDYVDVRISFPRQVWREFNHIKLNFSGAKVRVIVHDNGTGDLDLGEVNPSAMATVLLNAGVNGSYLDNVVGLTLRVRESYFATASVTMNLFNIALTIGAVGTVAPPVTAVQNEQLDARNGVAENRLSVFPNPAAGKVTASAYFNEAEQGMFSLVNSIGKTVYTLQQKINKGKNEWVLQLPAELLPGVYILKLDTGHSGMRTGKLTITR